MSDLKEKILDIIGKPFLGAFATITEDGEPWVRYVVAIADQTDLTIRFATFANARKVEQIKRHPKVHLTAGETDIAGTSPFVQIAGTAKLVDDRKERHIFWCDIATDIFTGPDDPRYGLIEIRPSRIELWGTRHPALQYPEVWEPS
ncbi:MAG: pyridoxamine 5'-phosphate oxidase family protein [Planctomycetia bacterium]|jgi:general stress protein 26